LYESLPIAYMWDDYDFGPNDADRNSPAKAAAHQAYREAVPHYGLVLGESSQTPIAQTFFMGRVRFILTDLRTEKSPASEVDTSSKTTMGVAQKEWLKQQLVLGSATHELVVWVSSIPWIHSGVETDQKRFCTFKLILAGLCDQKTNMSQQKAPVMVSTGAIFF
jgi:alkaline phosphatase D